MTWGIHQGDALERLREMPDESVQCCVTSPPYWGLRDYGVDGQLGLEATPAEFVAGMVGVFAEVRRVLRDDGTLWLNIGDSYAGSWGAQGKRETPAEISRNSIRNHPKRASKTGTIREAGLKPKDLVGIPWMLAFALRAEGWYLRRDIIWSKPNPMPENVTDRPTSAHEYVFLLSKSPRYFYDAEAIREPATWAGPHSPARSPHGQGFRDRSPDEEKARQDKQRGHGQALGRNKRSVWTIATRPFPNAHFATFPPELVEPCILAGTPPKVCGECGAPWVRQTDVDYVKSPRHGAGSVVGRKEASGQNNFDGAGMPRLNKVVTTTGWHPTCDHDDDSGRAVVLDPFAGAATTGLVATRLDRDFIGIELNPEYVELGRRRICDDAPLLNTPAEAAA